MASPSHSKVLAELTAAFKNAGSFKPAVLTTAHQSDIQRIIGGTHLTFRYILITALVSKVAEPSIHMRALQTGSSLAGAYDARSICHKVFVPFEHDVLDCRLGGSNEPYLNKPARFEEVDRANPVRGGNDQALLNTMHQLLDALNKADAKYQKEALLFGMTCILKRTGATVEQLKLSPIQFSYDRITSLLKMFLSESHGGETVAVVAAAVFTVRCKSANREVEVHPANEAGSSSNEIGDIDIKFKGKVVLPIEVKDKTFIETDVNHAISKARKVGAKLLFLKGRNARLTGTTESSLIATQAAAGFDLTFITIDELVHAEIALFTNDDRRDLVQAINQILVEMRAKDAAKDHWGDCIASHGLLAE